MLFINQLGTIFCAELILEQATGSANISYK